MKIAVAMLIPLLIFVHTDGMQKVYKWYADNSVKINTSCKTTSYGVRTCT